MKAPGDGEVLLDGGGFRPPLPVFVGVALAGVGAACALGGWLWADGRAVLWFGLAGGSLIVDGALTTALLARRAVRLTGTGVRTGWRFTNWSDVVAVARQNNWLTIEVCNGYSWYGNGHSWIGLPFPADRVDEAERIIRERMGTGPGGLHHHP